jgi:transcriptional regulator GlxA family with amidase domain
VLRSHPETPLARLAVERGYHDQAHMTREFREFAGLPPAAYALERLTGTVTGYGWR